jgi:hypothetical protein
LTAESLIKISIRFSILQFYNAIWFICLFSFWNFASSENSFRSKLLAIIHSR